jgi:hypothetical protein
MIILNHYPAIFMERLMKIMAVWLVVYTYLKNQIIRSGGSFYIYCLNLNISL